MVVSKGITEGDMFNKMLQGFHQELQAERAAAAPPSNSTGESQTEAEGSISVEEVAAAENRRFVKCHLKDCRRRSPTDCIHAMCFLCCYEMRRATEQKCVCPPHHKETLRREEEDRYIESLLTEKTKPRPLPRFFEEKFTAAGQTVTIWCLRDFLRNKSFCEETLQLEQRQFRQRALVRRREELRGAQSTEHGDGNADAQLSTERRRSSKRSLEDVANGASPEKRRKPV